MGTRWTTEQVLSLAPDASSVSAGRKLASPTPWSDTGAQGSLVWGLCKGSGAKPYQTVVDLTGPAYLCSCPSRKFPCKHAVGLLLLWAGDGVPEVAEPADFAAAWEHQRQARSEKDVQRVAAPATQRDPWRIGHVRSGTGDRADLAWQAMTLRHTVSA